jgi:hypothetical protein
MNGSQLKWWSHSDSEDQDILMSLRHAICERDELMLLGYD